MLIGKKEFLAGVLMATMAVAAGTELTSSYAISSKFSSEVEFSQSIGLFDSEHLNGSTLRSNIAEIAFYRGLNLVLTDKGIVDTYNIKNLEETGITSTASPMNSITRQKAAETILRAMMRAQSNGMIDVPNADTKVAFKDWNPDAKYQNILAYAVKNNIIKGAGGNKFKPDKKLSVKEALIFLRRLYEMEVTPAKKVDTGINQLLLAKGERAIFIEPDLSKFFNDISDNNAMSDKLKKLINAGAFDYTQLNHEISLTRSISTQDMALVCKGMLTKTGNQKLISNIDTICSGQKTVTRDTLAKIGAVMTTTYPHKEFNIIATYKDVEAGSPTDAALRELSKSGIRMGYADSNFKGAEKVSRFEAFSLLETIVGENVPTKLKVKATEKAAVAKTNKTIKMTDKDEDGLTFAERIQKRKDQFRQIINHRTTEK